MTAPATMPVFVDPHVPSGSPGPGFGDLMGRTVAIFPTQDGVSKAFSSDDKRADANGNVPTIWFDLYVVDGGPIIYGSAPKANPPRPMPTHQSDAPAVFRNQMTSHVNIHRALQPYVGKGAYVIGVIGRSTIGSNPYQIEKLAAGDLRMVAAQQIVTEFVTGARAEVPPTPLNFGAAPVAAPTAPPAAPAFSMPAMAPTPPAVTALATPPAAPAPAFDQAAFQAWQASQQAAAAPAEVIPPGIDPAMWAQMNPQMREYVRSTQAAAAVNPF